ncbi:hypothetical protein L6R50_03215 [Myxococcota bacterium]|nr:hypothetical protein [Myxococcota bacterium]
MSAPLPEGTPLPDRLGLPRPGERRTEFGGVHEVDVVAAGQDPGLHEPVAEAEERPAQHGPG